MSVKAVCLSLLHNGGLVENISGRLCPFFQFYSLKTTSGFIFSFSPSLFISSILFLSIFLLFHSRLSQLQLTIFIVLFSVFFRSCKHGERERERERPLNKSYVRSSFH